MSISWTPRSITTPMSRTRPGNELTRRAVAVTRSPYCPSSRCRFTPAISEYTRAWLWARGPPAMTPTRIGAVTVPRRRPPDINAWRARRRCRSLHIRSRLRSDVRCYDGGRSGVREARQPAQRVLDDLVQGDALLLLRGGLPAQVRPQAGALSAPRPGPTAEGSRLLIRPTRGLTRSFATPRPEECARRGWRGSRSRGPLR